MAFELPALPYASNALEPHIDQQTMEIHHGKHHQAYVTNLNKALEGKDAGSIEDVCRNVSSYGPAVRNNGGGHFNHSLFWTVIGPNGGGTPSGDLAGAIDSAFRSEEHTSELQSPMRNSYAGFCLKKNKKTL